jgi:hypothetical protein
MEGLTDQKNRPNTPLLVTFTERVNDGKYSMEAVIAVTMEGINICLAGGELSHLGSVAVSIPRVSLTGDGSISCTTSVFNFISHKDDLLTIPLAEALCVKTVTSVAVTAGVHVDHAKEEDITRLQGNFLSLKNKILAHFD